MSNNEITHFDCTDKNIYDKIQKYYTLIAKINRSNEAMNDLKLKIHELRLEIHFLIYEIDNKSINISYSAFENFEEATTKSNLKNKKHNIELTIKCIEENEILLIPVKEKSLPVEYSVKYKPIYTKYSKVYNIFISANNILNKLFNEYNNYLKLSSEFENIKNELKASDKIVVKADNTLYMIRD